jgi:transposase-like protein
MAKKGQIFKKYDLEFKRKIVLEHKTTGMGSKGLARKYDLNPNTIQTWIRIDKRYGELGVAKRGRSTTKSDENIDYKEKYEILKKFQEFLEEVDREKK